MLVGFLSDLSIAVPICKRICRVSKVTDPGPLLHDNHHKKAKKRDKTISYQSFYVLYYWYKPTAER